MRQPRSGVSSMSVSRWTLLHLQTASVLRQIRHWTVSTALIVVENMHVLKAWAILSSAAVAAFVRSHLLSLVTRDGEFVRDACCACLSELSGKIECAHVGTLPGLRQDIMQGMRTARFAGFRSCALPPHRRINYSGA